MSAKTSGTWTPPSLRGVEAQRFPAGIWWEGTRWEMFILAFFFFFFSLFCTKPVAQAHEIIPSFRWWWRSALLVHDMSSRASKVLTQNHHREIQPSGSRLNASSWTGNTLLFFSLFECRVSGLTRARSPLGRGEPPIPTLSARIKEAAEVDDSRKAWIGRDRLGSLSVQRLFQADQKSALIGCSLIDISLNTAGFFSLRFAIKYKRFGSKRRRVVKTNFCRFQRLSKMSRSRPRSCWRLFSEDSVASLWRSFRVITFTCSKIVTASSVTILVCMALRRYLARYRFSIQL